MYPLAGVTVLEFSTMISASFATMTMAEQGATVIKVEPMELGDPMRYMGTGKGGISAIFANCNRGKKSIRIDLKQEAGQALIHEMMPATDVVIHNFRPGVMDKLNLGSERLRAINPRLINIAISGFGRAGPLSHAPAYDPIIQAYAGVTTTQGADSPAFIRNLICDKITAYSACQAVTSALYQRCQSGEGQHIDLSMLDSALYFLFPDAFANHTLLDADVAAQPLLVDTAYALMPTRDGVITLTPSSESQRVGVLRVIGLESLEQDFRFNSVRNREIHLEEYLAEIAAAFSRLDTDDVLQQLQAIDVPCAKCLTRSEVIDQAQVSANRSMAVLHHPVLGTMRAVKAPARFGGITTEPGSQCPAHGEHTDSVLANQGIDPDRLRVLKDQGVIR